MALIVQRVGHLQLLLSLAESLNLNFIGLEGIVLLIRRNHDPIIIDLVALGTNFLTKLLGLA